MFSDYGHRWTCNLCGGLNEVPDWYVLPLDSAGRPVDNEEKPELVHGSMEAIVDGSKFNMNVNKVGSDDYCER